MDTAGARPEPIFKICIVGASGVGKTTFYRAICGLSTSTTVATIAADFASLKPALKDGHKINCELVDTPGTVRFLHSIPVQVYRNASAIITMFDITDRSTYDAAAAFVESAVLQFKGATSELIPDPYVILFGNKLDRAATSRAVPTSEVSTYCREQGYCYCELSARDTTDAMARFGDVCEELYQRFVQMETPRAPTAAATVKLRPPPLHGNALSDDMLGSLETVDTGTGASITRQIGPVCNC